MGKTSHVYIDVYGYVNAINAHPAIPRSYPTYYPQKSMWTPGNVGWRMNYGDVIRLLIPQVPSTYYTEPSTSGPLDGTANCMQVGVGTTGSYVGLESNAYPVWFQIIPPDPTGTFPAQPVQCGYYGYNYPDPSHSTPLAPFMGFYLKVFKIDAPPNGTDESNNPGIGVNVPGVWSNYHGQYLTVSTGSETTLALGPGAITPYSDWAPTRFCFSPYDQMWTGSAIVTTRPTVPPGVFLYHQLPMYMFAYGSNLSVSPVVGIPNGSSYYYMGAGIQTGATIPDMMMSFPVFSRRPTTIPQPTVAAPLMNNAATSSIAEAGEVSFYNVDHSQYINAGNASFANRVSTVVHSTSSDTRFAISSGLNNNVGGAVPASIRFGDDINLKAQYSGSLSQFNTYMLPKFSNKDDSCPDTAPVTDTTSTCYQDYSTFSDDWWLDAICTPIMLYNLVLDRCDGTTAGTHVLAQGDAKCSSSCSAGVLKTFLTTLSSSYCGPCTNPGDVNVGFYTLLPSNYDSRVMLGFSSYLDDCFIGDIVGTSKADGTEVADNVFLLALNPADDFTSKGGKTIDCKTYEPSFMYYWESTTDTNGELTSCFVDTTHNEVGFAMNRFNLVLNTPTLWDKAKYFFFSLGFVWKIIVIIIAVKIVFKIVFDLV
jgi:hypothetical protein